MKKTVCLAIMASLFSLSFAFANESEITQLVPATSLEQMMDEGMFETETEAAATADFDHGGHHRHHVICEAKNRRGHRFHARGFNPREVQWEAMKMCERVSRHCFELGCHRT